MLRIRPSTGHSISWRQKALTAREAMIVADAVEYRAAMGDVQGFAALYARLHSLLLKIIERPGR
jgi:hypothetical protein